MRIDRLAGSTGRAGRISAALLATAGCFGLAMRFGGQLQRRRVVHRQLVACRAAHRHWVNGTWHNAVKVPGIATLNQGGTAVINSVSCGSAGKLQCRRELYRQLQALSGVRGQ